MTALTGKIALVTGASRGIGQAIARKLGESGVRVIGSATTQAGADAISKNFKTLKLEGCDGRVLNIADINSIQETLQAINQDIGTIDILVNNAGVVADNLVIRMKESEWSKVIDTNLTGTFNLIQACLRPMMKNHYGRIVNITSVVALTGNAGQVNYSAAKAGIIGLTKSLAKEVASRNITVNAVAPGFIDTDMTRSLTEEQRQKIFSQIPLGRIGDPNDIADAVFFLIANAGYITGETLHVNGGMLMC